MSSEEFAEFERLNEKPDLTQQEESRFRELSNQWHAEQEEEDRFRGMMTGLESTKGAEPLEHTSEAAW